MATVDNILTFDIEEWYHANYCGTSSGNDCQSNFAKNMDRILKLCSDNNCKATFFVLGCIGESYRSIVGEIISQGHEVASHGNCHELAYNQTIEEFEYDVKASKAILEDITGNSVLGYRAPSWSITSRNHHYLQSLERVGFKYDASIFPTKNFLYGIPDAPRHIHKPVIDGRELKLYEVPTSVFNFMGRGIGYSGGFYFRFFPDLFIRTMIKETNKKDLPSVVYLHPREIDSSENRLELPVKENFIHYFNVGRTFSKLQNVMKKFRFVSIKEYIQKHVDDEF